MNEAETRSGSLSRLRERAGVTASEIEGLKVLVFAMPAIVVAMALFVFWLTGWMDRRGSHRIRPLAPLPPSD